MTSVKSLLVMLALVPALAMAKQKTILINSEKQDCIGYDNNKTKCLEYKEVGVDSIWQFVQQKIKGFKFQQGYTYTLLIDETKPSIKKEMSSDVKWKLVKVLKKEKVPVVESGELVGSYNYKGVAGEWRFTKMSSGDSAFAGFQQEYISFDDVAMRVSGKATCNRFFGSFTLEGNNIKFGPLGSTMMACPGLETENLMMKAFERVNQWKKKGKKLLLQKDGVTVFELERMEKRTI